METEKTLRFLSAAMTSCLAHSLPEVSRSISESYCGILTEREMNEKQSLASSKNFNKDKVAFVPVRHRNASLVCQYCGAVLVPGANCTLRVVTTRNFKGTPSRLNRLYRDFRGVADSTFNQRIRLIVNTCMGYEYFSEQAKKKRKMKNMLRLHCLTCKRTSLFFGAEKTAKPQREKSRLPQLKATGASTKQKTTKKPAVIKPQSKCVPLKKGPEKGASKPKKGNDGGLNKFLSGLKF